MGDQKNPLDKHPHSRNKIYVRSEGLDAGYAVILKPVRIFNKNETHSCSPTVLKNIGRNWR
jgi:hypothetical protein